MTLLVLNEERAEQIFREMVAEHIKNLDDEPVLWNVQQLVDKTGFCYNTLDNYVFHDPEFPQRWAGNRRAFPVQAVKDYFNKPGKGGKTYQKRKKAKSFAT